MPQENAPEIYPWRQWDITARAIVAYMDRMLSGTVSISLLDAEVLDELASSPEPRRMCDLGQSVAFTRSGMTRAIARLEKLGLVERTPSPSDKRSMLVSLTPEGKCTQQEAVVITQEHGAQLFGAVATADERRRVEQIGLDLRAEMGARQSEMIKQEDEDASTCGR